MFEQIITVTAINLRNIPARIGSSLVAVVGSAGVVAVLLALLALAAGFARTMESAGSPDRAVVLRGGANSEMSSGLGREEVDTVQAAPGVAAASPQLFVVLDLPLKSSGTDANVPMRGVTGAQFDVLDQFELVEGRRPASGKRELIAGRSAAAQFAGLEVGGTVGAGTNTWQVVGVFADGGSVRESEVWADAHVVQDAYNRGSSYSSVLVRLRDAQAFEPFKEALTGDPRLDVKVERETDYYAGQAGPLKNFISVIGYSIAVIMAVGAIFAALNTMYSSITARSREIGTLRALGFGGLPVLVSVLIEAMLLSLAGGLLGLSRAHGLDHQLRQFFPGGVCLYNDTGTAGYRRGLGVDYRLLRRVVPGVARDKNAGHPGFASRLIPCGFMNSLQFFPLTFSRCLAVTAAAAVVLMAPLKPAWSAEFEGAFKQGGLVIGRTQPGAEVTYDGRRLRVSPEGVFVLGFGRDAPAGAVVEIRLPDGRLERERLKIARREYPEQHIDGLPENKVTPSEKDLERIWAEQKYFDNARARDDARTDFLENFIWPVTGPISGVYGSRRVLNGKPKRPHVGVDIAVPTGTPVVAPAAGVVSMVQQDLFYTGGTVFIDHGHGVTTMYIHLSEIFVKEGQQVEQGEPIAAVGMTGRATGPHLHWAMHWFNTRLDPSLLVPPMEQVRKDSKTKTAGRE